MFDDGAFIGNLLYAVGQSSSKDLGYSFSFGPSDAVLMVINTTTDTVLILKHYGFGAGSEFVFRIIAGSNFLHIVWNENTSLNKTQVIYLRADLNGN